MRDCFAAFPEKNHRPVRGPDGMKQLCVAPRGENLETVTRFFEECLKEKGAPLKAVSQVSIAVDELFSNIVRYSGATEVTVGCAVEGGRAVLRFADDGRPYDPTQKTDPDVTLSAEEREIGGLGIFMVKKIMDGLSYEYSGGRNILTVEKRW